MAILKIIFVAYLFGLMVFLMFVPAYPYTWTGERVIASVLFWPVVWIPKAIKHLYIGLKEAIQDL